ncbi:MAG: sialate O-acetylesterase [Ignavibacteriaceae bacterium]
MKTKLTIIFIIVFSLASFGKVKLPKLISDGMILQRNTDVNIWGWADANENISVSFVGSTYNTIADNKGNWKVVLADLKPGGPYQMQINSITINNILVGDVWVCSGQSNMELPMRRVSWNYPGEIKHSENKYIRQFLVPDKYNFDEPQNDLSSGTWKSASPENTPDFSATAYFFAKFLYEKYKVPIGLINSALGGSPVESWISGNALKKFPKYYNDAKLFGDSIQLRRLTGQEVMHGTLYCIKSIGDLKILKISGTKQI